MPIPWYAWKRGQPFVATLSDKEKAAIAELEALAKKWPASLWIFSASGSLNVMKKTSKGARRMLGDSYDGRASVKTIDIENDGGDW